MTPFSISSLASASVIASVVTTSSSRDTVCDCRVLPLRLPLDDSVRSCQYFLRNRHTEFVGCLQVDNELKFRRPLDRQLRKLRSFQNLIYEDGNPRYISARSGP